MKENNEIAFAVTSKIASSGIKYIYEKDVFGLIGCYTENLSVKKSVYSKVRRALLKLGFNKSSREVRPRTRMQIYKRKSQYDYKSELIMRL